MSHVKIWGDNTCGFSWCMALPNLEPSRIDLLRQGEEWTVGDSGASAPGEAQQRQTQTGKAWPSASKSWPSPGGG